MIDHAVLKTIHVSCAALSLTGFVVRGGLMLQGSPLLRQPLVRILPHLVDTLLLISGFWLAYNIAQYPGTSAWLTAKLVALVAYILLGSVALRGRNQKHRSLAFAGSLLAAAYLVSVAVARSPLPLALLN